MINIYEQFEYFNYFNLSVLADVGIQIGLYEHVVPLNQLIQLDHGLQTAVVFCCWGGVGWGRACINVHVNLHMKQMLGRGCRLEHVFLGGGSGGTTTSLALSHTYVMLRYRTLSWTSTHASCYATVGSLGLPRIRHATLLQFSWASIRHATLLYVLLDFHAYIMRRYCTFSWTSTCTSCYATGRCLGLPCIRHVRYCTFSWTFKHTSCYATVRCLGLTHTHVILRYCTFSWTRTHTSCYATVVLLDFHTYVMLRYCTFSWTSTHASGYATVRSLGLPCIRHVRYRTFSWTFMHTSCYAAVGSLRLPCICHATLLDVVLNFHTKVMLRYCTEYRKGSRKNLKRCCEEKMAKQL